MMAALPVTENRLNKEKHKMFYNIFRTHLISQYKDRFIENRVSTHV